MKWPTTNEQLRVESVALIEHPAPLVCVPTINHLREIGKKLADEFHSVFVLDCCGMVCTYLID